MIRFRFKSDLLSLKWLRLFSFHCRVRTLIPPGHAPGMKEYLESDVLQKFVGLFFESQKPVGAICHGVVLLARSNKPGTDKSVLYGRKTASLPSWLELLAWNLTRLWMGNYYRTYFQTVQAEVISALKNSGFVVRDGNYLSARWPGDAHLFARTYVKILSESVL